MASHSVLNRALFLQTELQQNYFKQTTSTVKEGVTSRKRPEWVTEGHGKTVSLIFCIGATMRNVHNRVHLQYLSLQLSITSKKNCSGPTQAEGINKWRELTVRPSAAALSLCGCVDDVARTLERHHTGGMCSHLSWSRFSSGDIYALPWLSVLVLDFTLYNAHSPPQLFGEETWSGAAASPQPAVGTNSSRRCLSGGFKTSLGQGPSQITTKFKQNADRDEFRTKIQFYL